MLDDSDIIGDVIACLLSELRINPSEVAEKVSAVQLKVRRNWGGERVLVAKTSPQDRKLRREMAIKAAEESEKGVPKTVAAERYGVTRQDIYRVISLKGGLNRG